MTEMPARFYWDRVSDERCYEVRDRLRGSQNAPMAVCATADDAEEIVRVLNYREQLKPLRDELLRSIDAWKTPSFVRLPNTSTVVEFTELRHDLG